MSFYMEVFVDANQKRIEQLEARRTKMLVYLQLKVDEGDYHGVADAAMDLREIDAALREQRDWIRNYVE